MDDFKCQVKKLYHEDKLDDLAVFLAAIAKDLTTEMGLLAVEYLTDVYRMQGDDKQMKHFGYIGVEHHSVACMCLLARQCESNGDFKEMERLYKMAIALKSTKAMCDYGCYLGEHGQRSEARKLWLQGASLNRDSDCIRNINQTLEYSFSLAYATKAKDFLSSKLKKEVEFVQNHRGIQNFGAWDEDVDVP